MIIKNLTPHSITFVLGDERNPFVVEPSGDIARVSCNTETVGEIDGIRIPVTKTVFGEVEGLPDPEEGTIFIVSSLVAQRCMDREDVFIPKLYYRITDSAIEFLLQKINA